MLNIFRTKTFIKELKKTSFSDKHYTKYINYLALLINEEALPKEALNHSLTGEYRSYKEFHVSGDLLVVYCIEDGYLKLIRIGTHSEIFE